MTDEFTLTTPTQEPGYETAMQVVFQWNYEPEVEELRRLYAKATEAQWIAERDLDWDRPIDLERFASTPLGTAIPIEQTSYWKSLSDETRWELTRRTAAFRLSNFLHGEQGALIVASQLVGAVPWIDAKYYAGTQTMDEARHVEVFSRYVNEKLEWQWPINENLKELLDVTLKDSRWDFKFLGMQIIIEGLAMAAFGNLYHITSEPLLKELIHYVMRDESRHVAFGVLSLTDYYRDLPASELKDREDFIIYACELSRDRLIGDQIADAMGWNREEVRKTVLASPPFRDFRRSLFMRIVPNLKRLGLLSPRVREAFARLDILEFENADPEEQDRALGLG